MSQPARRCAVCGKAQAAEFRPFCSRRCADLDLARWLGEGYAIPAEEEGEGRPAIPEDDG